MVRNVITPSPDGLERNLHSRQITSNSASERSIVSPAASSLAGTITAGPLFYKVPIDQKKANPEAFSPLLYSFGPYNATYSDLYSCDNGVVEINNLELLEGDRLKENTAVGLLKPEPEALFQRLVDDIEQQDVQAIHMRYVQRGGSMNSRKLANILALDGILMVAATLSQEQQQRLGTPLIYPLTRLVLSDAILLENQIPVLVLFRVLRRIEGSCELIGAGGAQAAADTDHESINDAINVSTVPSLEAVISWYCTRASPFHSYIATSCSSSQIPASLLASAVELRPGALEEPLLAFVYNYVTEQLTAQQPGQIIPASASYEFDIQSFGSLPTASHLARCGVRFAPCTSRIFSDTKAVTLWLPKITLSDTTVRVLHNLLAYEATQKHPEEYSLISYVHFMDCLIDIAHDAQVLINASVVCSKLGSVEELASQWNKLCISVSCRNTPSDSLVMAQLEALSRHKWRRWRASFIDLYWERKPWLLTSIVAANFLLVFALLQTVFTILSYISPPS